MTFEFDAESDVWILEVNVSHDFKGLSQMEIEDVAIGELEDRGWGPFVEDVTGKVVPGDAPKGGYTHQAEIEFTEGFDANGHTIEQIGENVRAAISEAIIT